MEGYYFVDKQMLRNNLDLKCPYKGGRLLLEMCKKTGLKILNDRYIGDLLGELTCSLIAERWTGL